jgi:hypothetical protein
VTRWAALPWIVTGVVGWSLFIGLLAVVVQPPELLCAEGARIGPHGQEAPSGCERQIAEVKAGFGREEAGFLLLLWVGGVLVGAVSAVRDIKQAPRANQ